MTLPSALTSTEFALLALVVREFGAYKLAKHDLKSASGPVSAREKEKDRDEELENAPHHARSNRRLRSLSRTLLAKFNCTLSEDRVASLRGFISYVVGRVSWSETGRSESQKRCCHGTPTRSVSIGRVSH